MSGLCGLCRGSGNFTCLQDGRREFWTCQACGGAGVRAMHGSATWPMGKRQSGMLKPDVSPAPVLAREGR